MDCYHSEKSIENTPLKKASQYLGLSSQVAKAKTLYTIILSIIATIITKKAFFIPHLLPIARDYRKHSQ